MTRGPSTSYPGSARAADYAYRAARQGSLMAQATEFVRAAGGVVWRPKFGDPAVDGVEVVIIHRAAYDDWSLPKGKVEAGETDEQAAVREVEEETALRCELGPEIESTSYKDRHGRPKVVRYWAMTVPTGTLQASNEVDDARWVSISEARAAITYERDWVVIDSFETLLRSRRL